MNYVAHIHLAHISETSLLGNFLGDFVKGSDLTYLAPSLERGVRLHRAIDTFTDAHPLVNQLKQRFPIQIRRMSGVVIDIYFDHLLCRDWHRYNDDSLTHVLSSFYHALEQTELAIPGRYAQVKQRLLMHKWLHDYIELNAVHRAFYQIEKRLQHRVCFADTAVEFIGLHEEHFVRAFAKFYPDLIHFCQTHKIVNT